MESWRPGGEVHLRHLGGAAGTSCAKLGAHRLDLTMRGLSGDELGRHPVVTRVGTLAGREGDARLPLADHSLRVPVAVPGMERVRPRAVVVLRVVQVVGAYLCAAMGDGVESLEIISPRLGMVGPR